MTSRTPTTSKTQEKPVYQRHKDIKAIQNALGHERVETTDKYLRSLGINYGSELETPDAWLA